MLKIAKFISVREDTAFKTIMGRAQHLFKADGEPFLQPSTGTRRTDYIFTQLINYGLSLTLTHAVVNAFNPGNKPFVGGTRHKLSDILEARDARLENFRESHAHLTLRECAITQTNLLIVAICPSCARGFLYASCADASTTRPFCANVSSRACKRTVRCRRASLRPGRKNPGSNKQRNQRTPKPRLHEVERAENDERRKKRPISSRQCARRLTPSLRCIRRYSSTAWS